MSVKERMNKRCNRYGKTYPVRRIKREPMYEGQSLIKVEKDSEDDMVAVSTHTVYIKQEVLEERTTVVKQESSDIDVPVKDEIEIGPTVIQPQYIGSSLHTTDASKAELIQCGGADVTLGTTTPGAASHCGHSTGSRSLVHGGTSHQIKMEDKGILKGHNQSALVDQKLSSCKICEYKCINKSNLVRHMGTPTGEKLFSCNNCEYKYKHKSSLVRHIRVHTSEKPYLCNVCQYKSADRTRFLKHTSIHTGEKPYLCNVCQHKFAYKSHLLKHMCVHTGANSFSCSICEYKCLHKSYLVKHMRMHPGFSCNNCEYKCKSKYSLARHMRTHTREKEFSCNICQYNFANKSNLLRHKRVHTDE